MKQSSLGSMGGGSKVVVLQIPEDIYKYLHFVQLWIMPG